MKLLPTGMQGAAQPPPQLKRSCTGSPAQDAASGNAVSSYRCLKSFQVRGQHGVTDTRQLLDPLHDFSVVGHLQRERRQISKGVYTLVSHLHRLENTF